MKTSWHNIASYSIIVLKVPNCDLYRGLFNLSAALSTGDGFGHHWGRNGKLGVTVCPVIGTVGMRCMPA